MEAAAKAAREAARKPTNSKSHSRPGKSAPPSAAKLQTEAVTKESSDDPASTPELTQPSTTGPGGSPGASTGRGNHLLVVPHGVLHFLPFHALFDGQRYLIDTFSISYAPSATIFSFCHARSSNPSGSALVLGVPDAAAPFVLDETKAVAATIPSSELFLGDAATASVLQERGQDKRIIHIATHGYFRQDDPMFSGIRLGDGILSLYDLYQLQLPAELITLSGCATGLSVVADGDELLGLVRGLIYAGAQSALLTLWDVQDRSTAQLMASFYSHLYRGDDKAVALRKATLELREVHPHPYYWAPFVLLGGNAQGNVQGNVQGISTVTPTDNAIKCPRYIFKRAPNPY